MRHTWDRWVNWLMPLLVALATASAFSPTLGNRFVNWDDAASIVENPHLRRLGWDQVRWAFTTFHMGPYQPLSWLSLGLDYWIWGLDPRGFHLSSLIWQVANALSLYVLCGCLIRKSSPTIPAGSWLASVAAGFGALVFAVHPLRVESVAWATERRDLVSGFFAIWSVWAYLRVSPGPHSGGRGWLAMSWLLFVTSLLAKATAVGLPLVLTILDVYPLRRLTGAVREWFHAGLRPVWYEKAPFWAASLAVSIAAIHGQRYAGAIQSVDSLGIVDRLGVAAFGTNFYLWKTLVPVRLSPLYEMPVSLKEWRPLFVLCAGAMLAITLLAWRFRRSAPGVLAAWLSYLILLAPVSGLVQSGLHIAADRYTYLPCLGMAVLAGVLLLRLSRSNAVTGASDVKRATVGLLLMTALLGVLGWRQCTRWHDDEALWRHAVSLDPNSSVACSNLGAAWAERGRLADARQMLDKAVELRPTNAQAHSNLGIVLRRMGDPEAALQHHLMAVRLAPNRADVGYNLAKFHQEQGDWNSAAQCYEQVLRLRPDQVNALKELGIVYKHLGRFDESIEQYEQAMRLDPGDSNTEYNLAIVLAQSGAAEEAVWHYRQVLERLPGHVAASNNLAALFESQGRYRDARVLLDSALKRAPNNPQLLYRLGWLLATAPDSAVRDGPAALALAQRLAGLPRSPRIQALDTLAAAWAELGQFDQAIDAAGRAAELAQQAGLGVLANEIRARQELYRTGSPFREPKGDAP